MCEHNEWDEQKNKNKKKTHTHTHTAVLHPSRPRVAYEPAICENLRNLLCYFFVASLLSCSNRFFFPSFVGRSPGQVFSYVVVVWRTHRGGLVSRVFSESPMSTSNLCVMRRYYLGGRVSGIHITPVFCETCNCAS